MSDRGEKGFIEFPDPAARLYDRLTSTAAQKQMFRDIGTLLACQINSGSLLEAGFGPGRVLQNIHDMNKNIRLYGIDVSKAMVEVAKKNLKDCPVELIHGNIAETGFKDGFFDIVTCTGSFYLWDNPVAGLNEIYRILKKNGKVFLFETYQEYDKKDFKRSIRENLKKENILIKIFGPFFVGKQLKMTYGLNDMEDIIKKSGFKNNFDIEKIRLGNLNIWLKIMLVKK